MDWVDWLLGAGIIAALLVGTAAAIGLGLRALAPNSWRKRWPSIDAVGWKTAEAALLAIATASAMAAFKTYQDNNGNAMLIALQERDRAARAHYQTGEEGRRLMTVFADGPPGLDEADYRECDRYARIKIRAWANDYVNTAIKPLERDSQRSDTAAQPSGPEAKLYTSPPRIDWSSVNQLYDELWSSDAMLQDRYSWARALLMHAIDYLYIVHDAYSSRHKRYFTEDEKNMWRGYIDDLGTSPFFLLALYDGEKYGYMIPGIRAEIREYMRAKPKLACSLSALYPSFLREVEPPANSASKPLDWPIVLALIGLTVVLAVAGGAHLWQARGLTHTLRSSHYASLDRAYSDLLIAAIGKHHLRQPDESRKPSRAAEYDAYCLAVYKFLETIFDSGQSDENIFATWRAAIIAEDALHGRWFDKPENARLFKNSFREFIASIRTVATPTSTVEV